MSDKYLILSIVFNSVLCVFVYLTVVVSVDQWLRARSKKTILEFSFVHTFVCMLIIVMVFVVSYSSAYRPRNVLTYKKPDTNSIEHNKDFVPEKKRYESFEKKVESFNL